MRMRISTTMLAVVVLAVVFTLLREQTGRVGVIVFITGLGVTFGGVAALLTLFETIGALAQAQTWPARAQAVVATALVLAVGSAGMLGAMFVGFYLVRMAVS